MSQHAFDPENSAPVVTAATADPSDVSRYRTFEVKVQLATSAARASAFEVLAAEARVAEPGAGGRLGRISEVGARDLVVVVGDAADPDAALGAATEALRESLLAFRVTAVVRSGCASMRAA